MIYVENFLKSYSATSNVDEFLLSIISCTKCRLIFSTDTNWQSCAMIGEWDEETEVEDSPKGFIEILQNEWEIKR